MKHHKDEDKMEERSMMNMEHQPMENNIVYQNVTFDSIDTTNEDYITIKGYVNKYKDDNGNIIIDDWDTSFLPSGYNLDNYKKNPIVLYSHDQSRPIGKAVSIEVRDNGLYVEAQIFKSVDEEIYNMVKLGVINMLSVGTNIITDYYSDVLEAYVVTESNLWEVSLVTLPSNKDSYIEKVQICESGECMVLRGSKNKPTSTTPRAELDTKLIKTIVKEIMEED